MRRPVEKRYNAWFIQRHRRARAGISLLEVMFSIGVVMIGLVGIAALLPVGGALTRKGVVADAAARSGANAWREFRVRGMANPSNWRRYNESQWEMPPLNRPAKPKQPARTFSFCLDPLLISGANQDRALDASNTFPSTLAVGASTAPKMRRITLGSLNRRLPRSVAEQLFMSYDDLVFDRPSDRTLPPEQKFTAKDPQNPNPIRLKRNADCYISWMATIVPKLEDCLQGRRTRQYTLSIVVFNQRIIDTVPEISGERVVGVDFYGGSPALGGGDVQLKAADSEDLDVASGDWVMLSKQNIVTTKSVNVDEPYKVEVNAYKWYEVINAGELSNTSPATRDVTLVGPDWIQTGETYATIVDGVVNVVEKTIRLESSGLWRQ